MLHILGQNPNGYGWTTRKARLFACACCRRVWELLSQRGDREAVEAAERFADEQITVQKLEVFHDATQQALPGALGLMGAKYPSYVASSPWGSHTIAAAAAGGAITLLLDSTSRPNAGSEVLEQVIMQESRAQCDLLRDIVGDPFSHVVFAPDWFTPAITTQAAEVYDHRALPAGTLNHARLGTLADTLEEARCTDQAILGHLRGPGLHVRGCWVIDGLLDKK